MHPSVLTLPKRALKRRMKTIVIGCLHSPHAPLDVWDTALGIIEDAKPDLLIVTGDSLEASSVSHHPNDDKETLLNEYELVANRFFQLRQVAGRASLVRHDGNHEYRLDEKNLNTVHGRRLRSALHWSNHTTLNEEWSKWLSVPYRNGVQGCFGVGQLLTYHGHKLGATGDEHECLSRVTACRAPLGTLAVRSHTHKPVPPKQARRTANVPLPFYYANVGTLGPLDPAFAHNFDTSEWGHGVLEVDLVIKDVYDSKEWQAVFHHIDPS